MMTTRLWTKFVKANATRSSGPGGAKFAYANRPEGTVVTTHVNNLYQVVMTRYYNPDSNENDFIHLSIKRQDRTATHDWRDFQRIKNELCGYDWAGIEIYPPDEFLVDQADQYHLWCFPNHVALKALPFMWRQRLVTEISFGITSGSQRPWYDDERPDDLKSREDMLAMMREAKRELGQQGRINMDECEVCNEPIKDGETLIGCNKCARTFGPCCNSALDPELCIDCAE